MPYGKINAQHKNILFLITSLIIHCEESVKREFFLKFNVHKKLKNSILFFLLTV